jgi:glycosyltransferase involved in cell wall biosynthesis
MIDPRNPDFSYTPVSPLRCSFGYAPRDLPANPAVSIVTPFPSAGANPHETARAILNQSFQAWEWVIVDDSSTHFEALRVLEELAHLDPRIRLLEHFPSQGRDAAISIALRGARGDCIVPLEANQMLEPTALEKWVWVLATFPEFSFVNSYRVYFGEVQRLSTRTVHAGATSEREHCIPAPFMMRRSVLDAVGASVGRHEGATELGKTQWGFSMAGFRGVTVPEFLAWHRVTGEKPQSEVPIRISNKGCDSAVSDTHLRETLLDVSNILQKPKPRLLLIVPWLTLGGADKFNLDLIAQLVNRGWEVSVATTLKGDHNWLPQFSRATPDIFILNHFLRAADYPVFLRSLITSRQIDVVLISNSELGYRLLPYLRAHFPQVTFMDYCHSEEPSSSDGGYPGLSVRYHEHLDMTVTASEYLKGWMVKRGARLERVHVCYVSVDPALWAPDDRMRKEIRAFMKVSGDLPVIVYVGRLCVYKQPRIFAAVMKELVARRCRFTAWVMGDGEDRAWLEEYLEEHRLGDYVKLMGSIPPQQVRAFMAAADISFLPSSWEGIALTLYEAMAGQLAVVGAEVGGQKELVTEECGVLLPRADAHQEIRQYTAVLEQLLADPDRRIRMGNRARERICRHFQIDGMGERMIELIGRADHLHREDPPPGLDPGPLREVAPQAYDYIRWYQHFERLWFESDGRRRSEKWAKLYSPFKKIIDPVYRLGVNRGWRWLVPIKDLVKQRFGVE